MKKIIFLLLLLCGGINVALGQVSLYNFSASSGTYTQTTAAATLLPLVRADGYVSPAQNIGFTFNYEGANYTQFTMTSNGYISLGATGTANLNGNDLAAANATSRPIIAPLWDDLDGAGPVDSVASYEITGTAPNRVLTVEWRNWEWNWLSTTAVISFQAKLYETTNAIQFVYRQEATAVNNGSASIGIGSALGSDAGSFLNLTADAVPAPTSLTSVTTIALKPATGQIYTFSPPTCAAPSGLVVSAITTQGATLTWAASVPAPPGYQFIVQTSSVPPTGAGTSTTLTTANATGLLANTTYNVYLRKNCGTEFSGWFLAGNFLTLCNAQPEFSEDFENTPTGAGFLPGCFSRGASTGSVFNATGSVAPMSPVNRLFFSISATTNAFLILPQVSNLQANTHRLKLKAYATATLKTLEVGYLTNIADFATFVVVQSLALPSTAAATALEFTVIPTGIPAGISNLVLRLPTGTSTIAYVDDIKWERNTTCVEPTALIATNILTTSAQIDWSEPATPAAFGYEFFISTSVVTPLSTATPTGSVIQGSNSVVAGGLLPSTLYNVWVRSKCTSVTERSPWSTRFSFLTNCTDVTTFSQNFDAGTTLPTCWKKLGVGGTGTISATAAVSAPNSLSLNSAGTTVALQGLVIMPPVSNAGTGTHRLVFRARSTGTVGGIIQVGYVTDNFDGNTFVAVQSFTTTSTTTFDSFSAILGTAPGSNKFLAFRHAGAPANAVLIDNVSWEAIPSCLEPASVTASSITNSSATISWTEPIVPAALGYQYFLSTTNTAPSAASVATGSVAANISIANITGLVANTTYFVWVRSSCSATDRSAWTPSITFSTLCNAVSSLPWSENFDTTATGTNIFPPCWGFENITNTWAISTFPSPAYSGANLLRRTWSTNGWAFTPTVTLVAGTSYEFSYWMRANDGILPGYTIQTAVGLGQNAASMTTTLDTKIGYVNFAWTKVTLNFTPTTAGAYSFGVRAEVPTSEPNGINFDDFRIQVTPTCFAPSALVASAVTTTTATVSWTAPTVNVPANGYQYFLSTSNVAPSAASVATGTTAVGITTVNLTTLLSATNYSIWVRSACSATDRSEWSLVGTFTTQCLLVTTFTQNFDAGLTIPTCWRKVGTLGTTTIQASSSASTPNCLNIFSASAVARAVIAMPAISNASAGTHWLKFKARSSTTVGGIIEVGYLTNSSDDASFVSVQSYTTTSTTVYSDFTSFLGTAPGANQTLAFRHSGVPANNVLIDDVSWEPLPACAEPTGLVASNVAATSATVSWTASASLPANGYQYFLSTTNTAPSAASVATASVAAGILTVNLTTLLPATTYFVWVRSQCNASIQSSWSAPVAFVTECSTETVPTVLQTMEGTTGTNLPICWSAQLISGAATDNWIGYTPSGTFDEISTPVSGTRVIRKNYQNSEALLFSNALSYAAVTTPTRVSVFLQRNTSADANDQYKIFVNTTKSLIGATQILNIFLKNDIAPIEAGKGFYNYTANVPTSFHGQAQVFIIIQGLTSGAFASYSLGIDDFKVEMLPACAAPSALAASNVAATSATISWTASPSLPANGYQYFLSTTNTAPSAASAATASVAAGVVTVNLPSLLPATQYFVWVRSSCSATATSAWSTSPVSFATLCATITTLNQNFATFPPLCFSSAAAGTTATGPTGTAAGIWEADAFLNNGTVNNSIKVNLYSTNRIGWMVTPLMNLSSGNYKLSFDYGITTWNQTTVSVMGSDDNVKVLISTNGGTTWTDITTFNAASNIQNTSTLYEYVIPAASATSTVRFALLATDGTVDDAEDYDFFIDNFKVEISLSNGTFDNAGFSYYPNPVKDVLNLDYNQNITNVAVFNLLGQQVITKTLNANRSSIDMSNLSAGTYLVKITADSQVKTIKVIKE